MQDLFRNYFGAAVQSQKEANSELDNELNDYLESARQKEASEGQQTSEEEEEGSDEESSEEDSDDSDMYRQKSDKIKLIGSLQDLPATKKATGGSKSKVLPLEIYQNIFSYLNLQE